MDKQRTASSSPGREDCHQVSGEPPLNGHWLENKRMSLPGSSGMEGPFLSPTSCTDANPVRKE